MVIVKFQGGIGNQLFEYAFYKELKYLGKEVYADFSSYQEKGQSREYELCKIGIEVDEAPKNALRRMCLLHNTISEKVMYRLRGVKNIVSDEFGQVFKQDFFGLDDVMLDGYWQTKKYFDDVFDEVVKEIDFVSNLDETNRTIAIKMNEQHSVSIHMRFGDYVGHDLYSGICTIKYYNEAIKCIKKNVDTPVFYVITDDENMAEKLLSGEKCVILNNNRGEDSYKDMYLISQCTHHIMANSSFSWWGVMLDSQKSGITIAPTVWINGVDTRDIWDDGWIRIGG